MTAAPFCPRRAPVDAYGNGGFRFAEMSHRGSLLCLALSPDGTVAGHGRVDGSSSNEVMPQVAGREGRYLVTYGVQDGNSAFPWRITAGIAGRRVDWTLGRFPNFAPVHHQSFLVEFAHCVNILAADGCIFGCWHRNRGLSTCNAMHREIAAALLFHTSR